MFYKKMKNKISLFVKNRRLIRAVKKGKIDEATRLIQKGANVDATDIFGNSALMIACHRRFEEIAFKLISSGANVNKKNIWGTSPLISACWVNALCVVKKLINSGADVNAKDIFGRSPLMIVAIKGRYDSGLEWRYLGKKLIDKGACQEMRRVPLFERLSPYERLTVDSFNRFIDRINEQENIDGVDFEKVLDAKGDYVIGCHHRYELPSSRACNEGVPEKMDTEKKGKGISSVRSRRSSVVCQEESKNGGIKGKEIV